MRVSEKVKLIAGIVFLLFGTQPLTAQNTRPVFFTGGITEIFRIADILKQDKYPTEEDWNHPTGDYIAQTIVSQLGTQELKRISLNPSQLIISHIKAAGSLPGKPLFSDAAIDLIKKLETKYLRNN